jgi:prephenate dehydrogenase|tara:strand:+ start:1630 stop:2619 length:990 start_codon:yes stop_codon:yes gene_type:complete
MGKLDNQTISIIGNGETGSGIGTSLIKLNENIIVKGFDKHKEISEIALNTNAITKLTNNYEECVKDSNIILVATPTSSIYEIFENIKEYLSKNAVIIDTSDTKRAVNQWAKEILPESQIIGINPFKKHKSFENIFWGVVSYDNSNKNAYDVVSKLIDDLRGQSINIDIMEHDSFSGLVETMPIILSTALMNLSTDSKSWKEIYRFIGNKFNKFTDTLDNEPINSFSSILTNSDMLLEWVRIYISELVKLEKMLENNSENDIADYIQKNWENKLKIMNNIDPNTSQSATDYIPSASENILSLFVGSRAAKFFTKTKPAVETDKYGFKKRV